MCSTGQVDGGWVESATKVNDGKQGWAHVINSQWWCRVSQRGHHATSLKGGEADVDPMGNEASDPRQGTVTR